MRVCEAVYRVKPETPGLAAALGDVCALLKKFPESEKFYRQALLAAPADPDLHRALGQALLDEEKLPEAEVEFRTALKSDPRSRDAAQGLATSLYLQKRYAEAIPLLEALVRDPDPPAMLFFVLASCYDHLMFFRKPSITTSIFWSSPRARARTTNGRPPNVSSYSDTNYGNSYNTFIGYDLAGGSLDRFLLIGMPAFVAGASVCACFRNRSATAGAHAERTQPRKEIQARNSFGADKAAAGNTRLRSGEARTG